MPTKRVQAPAKNRVAISSKSMLEITRIDLEHTHFNWMDRLGDLEHMAAAILEEEDVLRSIADDQLDWAPWSGICPLAAQSFAG